MSKKVVLAFSGGLDTSFCAVYLRKEHDLDVHTVTINTGGFSDAELLAIEKQAYALGASTHITIDATENYYQDCIRYLVFGNVLKNNTYPLSVSAERMVQATSVARYTADVKADFVAHGSTGAGNDQVRFDMILNSLLPELAILTPIRDLRLSREEEINFLKENGVEMNFSKATYSINKGLWGTSVGGQETLSSDGELPEDAWPSQLEKNGTERITLEFVKGELVGVNERSFNRSVEAIQYLQQLCAPFAIGRGIHVGDTIIGIKGRVGFEAAAPMVILKAHHALEKHVLTKSQLLVKDQVSVSYGNWLHEGLFMDPVMRNIEKLLESAQENVTGKVNVALHPYRFDVTGIISAHDLMSSEFGTYGEMNRTWSGEDVKGFSRIYGNNISIYQQVNAKGNKDLCEK